MQLLNKVVVDLFIIGIFFNSEVSLTSGTSSVDILSNNTVRNDVEIVKTYRNVKNKTRNIAEKKKKKQLLKLNVSDPTTVAKKKRKFRKRRRKQKSPVNQSNNTLNKLIDKFNKNPKIKFDEFKIDKTTPSSLMFTKNQSDPPASITEKTFTSNETNNNISNFLINQTFVQKLNRCRKNRGGCAHICNPKGTVKCSCLKGFYLGTNKRSCFDLDECKLDNGGCEKECVNLIGSYFCKCPAGLTLTDDRKTCRDINECFSRNGHGPCQDTCVNTFGSYKCTCAGLKGTTIGNDGHTCQDLDECLTNNGGCSHNCINALSRSFCSCPDGMELSSDWKTCQHRNG